MCSWGRGTHITRDMSSPTHETHITSDMCTPTQERSSPTRETYIPNDMCSPTQETIPSDMCSPNWETYIPSDMCSPTNNNIQLLLYFKTVLVGICGLKNEVYYIIACLFLFMWIIEPSLLHVQHCRPQWQELLKNILVAGYSQFSHDECSEVDNTTGKTFPSIFEQ